MKIDHFSLIAPWYDRHASNQPPMELLKLVDAAPQSRLLDAGGGTGRNAQAFARGGVRAYVVDLSLTMARLAAQKDQVTPVCAAAEGLPFPNDYFDRIIMVDAFHHVVSQKNTVQEMWRVLKPGGRMVIEEPDIRTTWVKLIALAEKILLMRSHFLPPDRIVALFSSKPADIHIVAKEDVAWLVINKALPEHSGI